MSPVRDRKVDVCMANKKDLHGSIEKMREVAELLTGWADDMERSLKNKGNGKGESTEDVPVKESVSVPDPGSDSGSESVSEPVSEVAPPSFEELRGLLAAKSAGGYRTQVLALIQSYGAGKLSEVDPSHYADLMEAAAGLGGDVDAG